MKLFGLILLYCVSQQGFGNSMDTRTFAEFEWFENTNSHHTQSAAVQLSSEMSAILKKNWKLTTLININAQNKDGLQRRSLTSSTYSQPSEPVRLNDKTELELREFYLQKQLKQWHITVGKQQVVWGQADGLKVLDIINPQSFERFILDDFEDSRIPLWMLNLEWQFANHQLQMLWIPDTTVHRLPTDQATYELSSPRVIPQLPENIRTVTIEPFNHPNSTLENGDVGIRWKSFLSGWDVSFNYLYAYHDLPVFFQDISISEGSISATVTPTYERSHLIGGTFSTTVNDFTLRAEAGYHTNRYFLTNSPEIEHGNHISDELSYVFGMDWFGLSDTLISIQTFQSFILDRPSNIIRPQRDTTFTLLIQKDFLNATFKPEILFIHNDIHHDGIIRPKAKYDLQDNIKIWIGADIFYGNGNGLFSQFNEEDTLYIGTEISL